MDRSPKKNSAGKRVLIVEDHQMMREGLRSLLEEKLGYECVADANDGHQAVRNAKEFNPDLVIMDIALPNLNGIEATRQIKAQQPEIGVLILSMHASRFYILQALQAGASAYLLKDSALEDLATALVAVSKGGMYLSPAITTAAALKNEAADMTRKNLIDVQRLTKRELQVLQLIADGRSTKEIAAALEVSVKTVETHRAQIMEKLGIRSIAGLTKYCIREGLTSL
jgi:DNA-binding NarL/FixJ family response regulator